MMDKMWKIYVKKCRKVNPESHQINQINQIKFVRKGTYGGAKV